MVLLPAVGLLVNHLAVLAVVGCLLAHLGAAGHPVVLLVVPVVLLEVGHLVGLLGVPPEGLVAPGAAIAIAVAVAVIVQVGVLLRGFCQWGQIQAF